jgi:hypothetical protein
MASLLKDLIEIPDRKTIKPKIENIDHDVYIADHY